MALYSNVKQTNQDLLPDNVDQLISPEDHRDVNDQIIDDCGAAQVDVNPAITHNPNSPSSPQNPRAVIALPGLYPNYGAQEITAPIGVHEWDGTSWTATQIPLPSPYNYFRCRTTAIMTASTTITSIAIEDVGGLGWEAFAGHWVQIVNRRTGAFEFVQLTADMEQGDTTISVASYQLQNTFPAHSIIECYPVLNMRKWSSIPVVGAGLDYVNVTGTWRMPPVEAVQYTVYMDLLEVYRNGLPCRYASSPASEREYTLDPTDRTKVIFGTVFVDGEEVSIRYLQPAVL